MRRGIPTQAEHEKVWGFEGLPLESPLLSPHIGAAARKRGGGKAQFPASRWESRLFRAFAVREDDRCDGRVRFCAPRVVLRFESLKNGSGL
jgi:hypothetical protein